MIHRVCRTAASGAIAETINVPGAVKWARLVSVFLTLETAPVVSNTLTIKKDSGCGPTFDIELYSADLNGLDEARFYGEFNVVLEAKSEWGSRAGDAIAVAFPNAGDGYWTLEAIFLEVE